MIQKLMMILYLFLERKSNIPKHSCPAPPPMPDNILIIDRETYSIVPEISTMVIEQEKTCGVSGEFKRHNVYAKAIKKYPEMKRSDISLAIELAIKELF